MAGCGGIFRTSLYLLMNTICASRHVANLHPWKRGKIILQQVIIEWRCRSRSEDCIQRVLMWEQQLFPSAQYGLDKVKMIREWCNPPSMNLYLDVRIHSSTRGHSRIQIWCCPDDSWEPVLCNKWDMTRHFQMSPYLEEWSLRYPLSSLKPFLVSFLSL